MNKKFSVGALIIIIFIEVVAKALARTTKYPKKHIV